MNEDILNPSLFIGNIEWREPITSATDLVFAMVGFWAFYQFLKKVPKGHPSHPFFRNYFFFMGLGMTCAGIIGHGAQAYLSFAYKSIGWTITSIAFYNLQMGSLYVLKDKIKTFWFKLFRWTFLVQILVYWFLLTREETRTFEVAQLSTTVSVMFLVTPLAIYSILKKINPQSKGIIAAILFALVPAILYNNEISVNRWFNYHDISHLLSAVYIYLMYRGCKMVVEYRE